MSNIKKVAVCKCDFCGKSFEVKLENCDCVSNDLSLVKNHLCEHNIFYCSNCEAVCDILSVKNSLV